MSDQYDDQYDDDHNDDDGGNGSNAVRNQRQRIRSLEAEKARLEAEAEAGRQARIQLAVQGSGLDTSSKTVQKFLEHYQGDPTPEALKAAAAEWGLVEEQTPVQQQSVQGQQQMAAAMGGGDTGTIPPAQTGMGHEVPADQAAMWEEFERAVKGPGGARAGADVLAQYGHDRTGWTESTPIR